MHNRNTVVKSRTLTNVQMCGGTARMTWSLFIGIITLQQFKRVSLSCRDQKLYVTEHEWEEIFQNNQHVYNDVRAVECVYRCMTLEHQVFEAVSDVTSKKCSCLSDSMVVGAAERANNIPVLVVNLGGMNLNQV